MMNKIRLTKEFTFEAAHALWNYDGLCRNVHGHSYRLFVTLIGAPERQEGHPKLGMVMDFGDLKTIVREEILNKFDHSVMFYHLAPVQHLLETPQMFERHFILDYQPTCENLLFDFARRIQQRLPVHIKLHSLKLYETATSYAEWYASDNTPD